MTKEKLLKIEKRFWLIGWYIIGLLKFIGVYCFALLIWVFIYVRNNKDLQINGSQLNKFGIGLLILFVIFGMLAIAEILYGKYFRKQYRKFHNIT